MNDHFALLALGWIGIYAPVSLGAIGASIGCTISGQAAIGAMMEVNSGYGRFVGLSALPSSMSIYGIVVMFILNRPVIPANAGALFGLGMLSGLAFLIAAIYQGLCCASAIAGSKSKPEIFGLALAPAAIVEGFAVFAFVFALVAAGGIPSK
ncbi:ATP synthase subunit C [Synechococcus sp. CS-1328]|uniref:ATP synthase subunit C n=1 Tax=Synechococcus sp. CS-1328 TaxID=2847976 RepID=UPI00223AE17A|nr:ATP synthase subunit C [Synechococcus sp. CS-1328]MCT0225241.1 ATP synthase subunit C [Synechococcus sp. CS-1328]